MAPLHLKIMPRKKKETTTGDVAPFQHRWGNDPLARKHPRKLFSKEWDKEDEDELIRHKKKSSKVDESRDREGFRLAGLWTWKEPKPYDHPLNDGQGGELDSKNAPKISGKRKRMPKIDPHDRVKKNTEGNKLDEPPEPETWPQEPSKNPQPDQEAPPEKDEPAEDEEDTNESTISGQAAGSPSQGAVAGTDTRFGGPTFEPVFFDDKSPDNNAIQNEKRFWSKTEKAVLLPGFEYVGDYANRKEREIRTRIPLADIRFDPHEIDDSELDADEIEHKKKTGIRWELDGPQSKYRELLRKLRDAHNI